MTIAIISSRFPRFGGETFLGVELGALRPHFERVIVVPVRDAVYSRETLLSAVHVARTRPKAFLRALRAVCSGSGTLRVLLKNLVLFPKALAVARQIERERVDHIHAYWLSAPATVALVASELLGIPWSSSAHRWDIYERNLLKRKADTASFVRTISALGKRDLAGLIDAKDRGKVRQVPVGVKIPPAACTAKPGPLRLVCAANLIEQKGHADLLEALAIASARNLAFTCDIVGSGPAFARLSRTIERLGLSDRVVLCGRVPHDALLERLQQGRYDAAVLASRDDAAIPLEGIPVALMEAMAAGLPCIATASGGIPELIDDSVGCLARPGDAVSLAAAIERISSSPDLRARLGRNARQRVIERFNIDRTGPALAELILRA